MHNELNHLKDQLERSNAEVEVLELAVRVITDALDKLISASVGADGKPTAPPARDIIKARSMLPSRYTNSLTK